MSESNDPAAERQLPRSGEIFLDHVGHFVREPQAASHALARAGFLPTPLSTQRNPDGSLTGTGNVCAVFSRGYIECLFKTAETPLAREFDAALDRYCGVHLAAFAVADAAAAHARLSGSRFRMRPLVKFERPVATENDCATAAFTVARVEPGEMPEGRIQILTHHTEEAVWQRRWLSHPNGALGLASITIAVPNVAEAAARFSRFTGCGAVASGSGMSLALDRGRVHLVTAEAFARALPEIAIPSLPFAGAYGVIVKSLGVAEALLRGGNIRSRSIEAGLVVPFPEELGQGAWLLAEDE